jgi:hypothetical protein
MPELYETLDQIEAAERIAVPPNASPLDFLCAVYRDPRQPMQRRMKAAIEAAPYTHPRLAVTAVLGDASDFASRLELACARSAKVIEARAEPKAALPPIDLRLAPCVPDRRFRRG